MSGSNLPLVSVIVPAYNAARYISETLDTILAQTYPAFEVIVADDGSTDGTRECVLAYGDRVRYFYHSNGGGSKPRNTGIAAARGSLVLFIDSDDLMLPGRIAEQVAFMLDHPDVGLVFSDYKDFDEAGVVEVGHFETCALLLKLIRTRPGGADSLILSPAESTELMLSENFGSGSPMIRREVTDVVGGFDESLRSSEDYEFQYRVASKYPIAVLPKILWHKRIHRASVSSNDITILQNKIVTRRRLLDRETVPRRRRKLKRMLGTYYWSLAYHQTGNNNALALRHGLNSLRYKPHGDPRLFARLLLDVLGRKVNRTAIHRTEAV